MWPTVVHEVARPRGDSGRAGPRVRPEHVRGPEPERARPAGQLAVAGLSAADWAGPPACGTAVLANAPAAAAAVTEITSTDGTPTAIASRFRRRSRPS